MRGFLSICLILLLLLGLSYGQNYSYDGCKAAVLSGEFGLQGTVDQNGQQANNVSAITGYTYEACKQNCGSGSDYNSYTVFWEQALLWFLPWFVLLTQVPFSTSSIGQDFVVMFLSVGSPTTALLSLFVTILDRRWLKQKCDRVRRRHRDEETEVMLKNILEVLSSLHQFPIGIEEVGLMACALAVKKNKEWWRKLRAWFIGRRRVMEASAFAQLLFPVVIYVFYVLPDALLDIGGTFNGLSCLTHRRRNCIWHCYRKPVDVVDTSSLGVVCRWHASWTRR